MVMDQNPDTLGVAGEWVFIPQDGQFKGKLTKLTHPFATQTSRISRNGILQDSMEHLHRKPWIFSYISPWRSWAWNL